MLNFHHGGIFHKTKAETLQCFAVGWKPDGGSHEWLVRACEKEAIPTLAGINYKACNAPVWSPDQRVYKPTDSFR